MADPITMMAASTALSAYGAFEEGQAANKAGKYNRDVAYREAEALDIQAEQEVAAGSFNSQRIKRRAEEILAEMRAKASKGGQSATDATVVALERETVKNTSLDQLLAMAEAEERAQQIKHKAVVTRNQGDYMRYTGKVQQKAANLRAAGTILQGGMSWMDRFGGAPQTPSTNSVGGIGKTVGKTASKMLSSVGSP